MENVQIGIVVIGLNEGERLTECLASVLSLNIPVVYVDSQSKDNSVTEARSRNVSTLVLDSSLPVSAARARNVGFGAIVEDYPDIKYIHFIDADCELDVFWLDKAIGELEKNIEVAVVCGRLREKYRNESIYMRLCDMDWYKKPGIIDYCGGVATYRREIFERLNGFNLMLIAGEEPELCKRIRDCGYKIYCIDAEMGTHDSGMRHFYQWWIRSIKVGYGFMSGATWGGWQIQYKRSLIWGGCVPVSIMFLTLAMGFWGALLFLIYPIQVFRIYVKLRFDHANRYDRFLYSIFCVLSKFPELIGIIKFQFNKERTGGAVIQYK